MSLREAIVIVDLGFGDAGKGLVTDFLVRERGAHTVVRYNGGAQAGHNVVTSDGRHHTFAQIGAGTFVPGVRTHLMASVIVHPTALLVEAEHLARKRVPDALSRLSIAREALVITPYHQAAGRLRELARGKGRHGSCGVGVGEAVADSIAHGDCVHVGDLADDRAPLRARLERIRERARASVSLDGDAEERKVLEDRSLADRWIDRACELAARARIVDDEAELASLAERTGTVVFEGAQGVLLDAGFGFHPYTTWSDCTSLHAVMAAATHFGRDVSVGTIGVVRTFATRHGPGPFPTEDETLARILPRDRHNSDGPWQGPLRLGWPDLVLMRYAIEACGRIDGLAITHLDALARTDRWRVATGYDRTTEHFADSTRIALSVAVHGNLPYLEELCTALFQVEPRYEELAADHYPAFLSDSLQVPIRLTSRGPTADDVRSFFST